MTGAALDPHSLRVRLTVAFVALGGLLVVVASVGVSHLLARAVWRPLDAALEEEADHLGAIAMAVDGDVPQGRRLAEADLIAAVDEIGSERDLGPSKFVEVIDANGRRRASHGAPPEGFAPLPTQSTSERSLEFIHEEDKTFRVARQRIVGGGVVSIGIRADLHVHSLARSRLALGFGATLFLLLLAGLAWQITTRATAEIDRVARDLEALEADSLDRRLPRGSTTEVDRLIAALNRMLARLEQAVSHLRRFTADAAHELRTPLATLRARIEGALAAPPSIDDYRDGLIDSLEHTERLSVLAEDLLTMSAVEAAASLAHEAVDVGRLVDEVGEFFAPIAEEQGRTLDISARRSCTVSGSARLLKRVLINLIDNAFRHTAGGSSVRISVDRRDDIVFIHVGDEGPGFELDSRGDLFRRFARGTGEHAGAGLGLALCQEIVRKQGGTISIESSVARGTTVSIALAAAA